MLLDFCRHGLLLLFGLVRIVCTSADLLCWSEGFPKSVCCGSVTGYSGNPNCWNGEFTFERCCGYAAPATESVAADTHGVHLSPKVHRTSSGTEQLHVPMESSESLQPDMVNGESGCWSQGFPFDICCDLAFGPNGHTECWDGEFTFERCCRSAVPATKSVAADIRSAPEVHRASSGTEQLHVPMETSESRVLHHPPMLHEFVPLLGVLSIASSKNRRSCSPPWSNDRLRGCAFR